ncbi:hypothetical protein [Acinetobacter sp. YH12134]|uniref:hypothetical protein n=1 Tax=Acinetobacter sp. YH12134 TaxID=2601118 RepID=UPI00211DD851|nr:hypothetical protein [Acinetobacter sp. YH12134]
MFEFAIYPAPTPAISDAPFVASAADTATIPITINPVPPVAKPTINAAVNVPATIPVPSFAVSTTVVLALSSGAASYTFMLELTTYVAINT